MKRVFMLAFFAAISISMLASCSNFSSNIKIDNDLNNPDQKMKPITLRFYSADPKENTDNFDSPVAKKITEKTGVTLDVEYLVGDNSEKISIMVASGDYPDLIYAKGETSRLVQAGALIDLTDRIDQCGTNIKKLYGKYMKRLSYSLEDKSIYFLGSFGVNDQDIIPSSGFQIQHAVVKEAGYPRLRTLKDYENVIKAYKEKYPTIDGQPTIGMSMCADGWRTMITVTNPAAFATGQNGDDGEWFIDQQTHKAVLHITRPEEKEYFRWLNHMYDIGLLDPESFVQKYEQYAAKIASGRVLGLSDAIWEYHQSELMLKEDGKFNRMYGIYPLTLNEHYINNVFLTAGYDGGWGIGITRSCKDPQRAFEFLDWMASDEAQILNNWGIEGINYLIINGKRIIPDEEWKKRNAETDYNKRTGIGFYSYPFPEYGKLAKDSTGQYYKPESAEKVIGQYSNAEKEVLDAYGAELWRDLFKHNYQPKIYGNGWEINIPTDSYASLLFQKIQEINRRRIPQAVLSKPNEFDSIWDDFQKELADAGVHKLEDEYNRLLANRIQLWNN